VLLEMLGNRSRTIVAGFSVEVQRPELKLRRITTKPEGCQVRDFRARRLAYCKIMPHQGQAVGAAFSRACCVPIW
jgi:hypothetical protein